MASGSIDEANARRPGGAVVHQDPQGRGKPGQFPLPVSHQRNRAHQQRWPFCQALFLLMQEQRDDLNRLAQTHVVNQAGARPYRRRKASQSKPRC